MDIATSSGKSPYRFSNILKFLKLSFDSILPKEISNYGGNSVLITRKEYHPNAKNLF
jgi:hypothetical protein